MPSVQARTCPYCGTEYLDYNDHILQGHPINCEEVKKHFSDFSDGKLDEETDEKMICHIADCQSCKDALSQFVTAGIQAAIQRKLEGSC